MIEIAIRYDDKFVKRPQIEIEYSPENILELQKCSKDITYFQKYIKIIHPDKGEIFFEPYKYQNKLINKFKKHRYNVVLASRQSGKCLEKNSIIKIRNKKTNEIESITIKNFYDKFEK